MLKLTQAEMQKISEFIQTRPIAKLELGPIRNLPITLLLHDQAQQGPHVVLVRHHDLIELQGKRPVEATTQARFRVIGVGVLWVVKHFPEIGARLVMERLIC